MSRYTGEFLPTELLAAVDPAIFADGVKLYNAYSSHRIIGAAIDVDFLPFDVRKYARYQQAATRDFVGATRYDFAMVAPGNLYRDYNGKLCLPYIPYLTLDPALALKGRQLTGDCVSWSKRTMADVARCFEIARGEFAEYRHRGATALNYAERGHTGQGASPSRLARALIEWGILLETTYTAPDGVVWDFTNYDSYYKIGVRYGRTGLPAWLKAITKQNAPKQLARIRTEEELLTAFWNGCGVGVGSGIGVANRGGKDGVPFLSPLRGSWPHDMAIIGFDARKKYHRETLIIWDQSWGIWNQINGWPEEYGPKPEGAFVLTLSDTMKAVRGGECHAVSDVEGFRPRRLADYGATGRV